MGQKFDKIWESVASRHTSGGYLPGDFVTFRKTYKSADCYKSLPTKIQKELDELVKSGLNIRVTQVGNNLGGHSAQNQNKTASSAVITVAGDHGGGRHYGMIAVSPDMIDLVEDDYPNTGKVPDQFKRKEKITIKPEPYKADDKHITRVTDKGNGKNTPTQLKLAGESTISKNSMSDMAMLYESVLEEGWMDRLKARGAEALGSFKGAGQQLKGGIQKAAGSALSKAGDWAESGKFSKMGQDLSQQGQESEQEGGFSGHNAKIQYLQKNIDKRTQSFVDDIKNDIKKLGLDIGNIEIVSGINDALNQLKKSVSSATPPPLPPQSGATPPPLPKPEPEMEPEEDEPENPVEYSYKKAISKKRKPQPTPDPRKGKVKKDPLAKYAAPEEEEDDDEVNYESFSTKNSMLDMAMLYESMNVNMDDPKDLMLHIRHAKKTGDVQKVESLTNRLRTVALRLDMLDDPDILDVIGNFQESKSPLEM